MDWKEISEEEAKNHPDYGFGGGLYAVYAICVVWSLHSLYIVFLDSSYALTQSYGYENMTMADFTCFIQFCLMLPFMYLAPKMHRVMPDVAVSLFSVNWAIWFTFGMISPKAVPMSIIVTAATLFMVVYIARSTRVNVTYRHRIRA